MEKLFAGMTEWHTEQLNVLLKTDEDKKYFWDQIVDLSKPIDLLIFEMKMYKSQAETMTEDEFVRSYDKTPIEALESLFLQPVSQSDYSIFETVRKRQKLTLSEIYRKKKCNVDMNVMQAVL